MTDLDVTRLCAQAMALVKKFPIECVKAMDNEIWSAKGDDVWKWDETPDLNRAICECVAKIWAKKEK